MRRTNDPGKRQKMETHDHRAPVRREIVAMKPVRQDHREHDRNDLQEHNEQEPFQDGLRAEASAAGYCLRSWRPMRRK
jgi:hypothetical protein